VGFDEHGAGQAEQRVAARARLLEDPACVAAELEPIAVALIEGAISSTVRT
jgi:hypothetical protein